jgi:hypothetical protein
MASGSPARRFSGSDFSFDAGKYTPHNKSDYARINDLATILPEEPS